MTQKNDQHIMPLAWNTFLSISNWRMVDSIVNNKRLWISHIWTTWTWKIKVHCFVYVFFNTFLAFDTFSFCSKWNTCTRWMYFISLYKQHFLEQKKIHLPSSLFACRPHVFLLVLSYNLLFLALCSITYTSLWWLKRNIGCRFASWKIFFIW